MDQILDCRGMACPLPVVKTKKAFEEFKEAGTLEVQVDNDTSVQNLLRLAGKYNFEAAAEQKSEKNYSVKIAVKPTAGEETKKAAAGEVTTVVLSANTMGSGNDELGKVLMKSFIFALTNVDPLPTNIICYNSGAFLTTEGSDSLEDLKNLEKAGVNITTCGTCLNFYKLTDKLKVGTVSNMYDIADTLANSTKVIRP